MKDKLSLMFLAGEASGDGLAAELLQGLRSLLSQTGRSVDAFGAGGERLKNAGAEIAIDLTQHAVVGIIEVLKHFNTLKGFFLKLLDLARAKRPDVIILVDYPGFNLRFAKALKKWVRQHPDSGWDPKIVQFISPQIWAWHESRIHQIARDMDMVLSIFPFEKAWYAQRAPQLRVEYVGHPLMDRYKEYAPQVGIRQPSEPYHVLLLPGSREKELNRHLPVLGKTMALISKQVKAEFRLVVPQEKLIPYVRNSLSGVLDHVSLEILPKKLAESLLWADSAIASSGTVTMECAYFQVPTAILYKTSLFTEILGRMFIKVEYIGMPNLLLNNKEVYPEFIQRDATPENLSEMTLHFLTKMDVRNSVQADLRKMLSELGGEGACKRAAEQILKLIDV
jgi:lipid-A-disaccharide synthase